MKRFLLLAGLALAAFMCALPARAQQPRKSPHETISRKTANDNLVTIVYGRPYTKDPKTGEPRKVWGGVVPYGKIWRLGADEATLFITQKPLVIAGKDVPAGAYTLYMLVAADGSAQLIINKEIGQWGLTYHPERDLVRLPLQKQPLSPTVDQFTITIDSDNGKPGGGVLKFAWEQTQYSVPFAVQR